MKNRKSYYSLLLALVLCLCLTACGGSGDTIDDGGEDYSGNEVNTRDSFEGMVKDSELATNYAMYWGTWVDADNNSELLVAMADSGDEVRFDLYQDGSIEASGFVQFSQEYSGDYFYNEFDGWAHHCWLADDGTLQIEGFGGFELGFNASNGFLGAFQVFAGLEQLEELKLHVGDQLQLGLPVSGFLHVHGKPRLVQIVQVREAREQRQAHPETARP